jgi:ABC-type transport system involved in multi-copper enzyme maturation permease subunit
MIATIKSEWRKNRFRPALLIGTALMGALPIVAYAVNWFQATNPGNSERPVTLASLYPDQFLNNALGASFPLGAAMAIVLGAIIAGSDYNWGTLKTVLMQGPGRLSFWAGRLVVFSAWMAIITIVVFAVAAACSTVVALFEAHTITWPAFELIAKGFGAIWLILIVNGTIGLALGVVIRQSATALGIGLVYFLSVEGILLRFVDGLNNGSYQWIGKLFVDQNASALLQHLVTNMPVAPTIGVAQAILVLAAYGLGLTALAAGFLRMRDVT